MRPEHTAHKLQRNSEMNHNFPVILSYNNKYGYVLSLSLFPPATATKHSLGSFLAKAIYISLHQRRSITRQMPRATEVLPDWLFNESIFHVALIQIYLSFFCGTRLRLGLKSVDSQKTSL